MERVAVIEVYDRQGNLIERFNVSRFPVTLGRAWDNDLIIDDPYVCPHHCTITRTDSGALVANDLTSVNGIFAGEATERTHQHTLEPQQTLRLGHTLLRIRLPGEAVAPALCERTSLRRGVDWPAVPLSMNISIVVLAALVMVISGYLDSFTTFDYGRFFFGEQLPAVIAVAGWAAVWSVVSRITLHRFAFFSHVTILVSVLLALYFADALLDLLKFGFAIERPFEIVSSLLSVVGLALLFYWSLLLCSEQRRRRLLGISVTLAVIISGLVELNEYLDAKEFKASPAFATILKPPALQMVKSESVESFFASADRLREGVEAELSVERKTIAPLQPASLPAE